MSENKTVVEMHGCIVCARIFNILAIYTPDSRLVDCTVTSPGGQAVPYRVIDTWGTYSIVVTSMFTYGRLFPSI